MRLRLSLLMFLNYAAQGAWVPVFSLRLAKELGFGPLEIGWACSTQALAALATPLIAGQVADRWFPAQRCLAVFSLTAGALLWLLPGLSSPPAVFAVTLTVWLMMGPASTLCATLCFAHLPRPDRDFGPARMCGTLGWAAAGWLWLAGWRLDWFDSLADIFRWGGVLAFALGAYALTLPHTPPLSRRGGWLAPLEALRHLRSRSFLVYWGCSFGVCLTLPFTIQLIPLLLGKLGIEDQWVSPTLTLGQTMEVPALAVLPLLLLRLGTRGTMLLGLLAWTVLLGVMTLGEPLWLVVAALSLNGLCICGFIVAGQVFVNSRARGDVRATAQALLVFVNGSGMLAGNLLAGWVRRQVDGQLAPTFAVAAGIAALLVLVFFLGFREETFAGHAGDQAEDSPAQLQHVLAPAPSDPETIKP